jgi:hypothetical protein
MLCAHNRPPLAERGPTRYETGNLRLERDFYAYRWHQAAGVAIATISEYRRLLGSAPQNQGTELDVHVMLFMEHCHDIFYYYGLFTVVDKVYEREHLKRNQTIAS